MGNTAIGMLMETDRRLLFTMVTMMACYAVGSCIMCVEMPRLPHGPLSFEDRIDAKYIEKERFWEWDVGNGYVSACENMVMMLSLFFGFMRTIDLLKEFERVEQERRWVWFWNLCEENSDENTY